MPHILRIDKDPNVGQQDHQDWTQSRGGLTGNRIEHIPDTLTGGSGTASKAGTSIPSPFARLYLFDTAFRMVKNDLHPRETSLYHVLVSHCLDLLELLFQGGPSNADITYRVWSKGERLEAMRARPAAPGSGARHPHAILGKALELDLQGDLGRLTQITMIYYKGALLGGTSPLTLVFTSPNWEQERQNRFIEPPKSTNGRTLFRNEYVPLHERDIAFVTYLARVYREQNGLLTGGFREFLYKLFDDNTSPLRTEVNKTLSSFDAITVGGETNATLQVVPGLVLYGVREADVLEDIERESDFVIQPTVDFYAQEAYPNGAPTKVRRPLALASRMEVAGKYVKNTDWNPRTEVLPVHLNDLSRDGLLADRYLPGVDNVRYPFVSTDDFLEDFLVRMPFRINNERFQTGMRDNADCHFLLPVRKEYFNFFTPTDLERYLTIQIDANMVTASLEVPVKGNRRVTFRKSYDLRDASTVVEFRADLAFFPFYRVTRSDLQHLNQYTVMLADSSGVEYGFKPSGVQFYQFPGLIRKAPLPVPTPEPRSLKTPLAPASYYYKVPQAFDLVEVHLNYGGDTYRGLMLPQFRVIEQSYKAYTFAIDFGTSNTHVAFLENDGVSGNAEPQPLTTANDNEMQVVLLNKPYNGPEAQTTYQRYALKSSFGSFDEMEPLIRREFIPTVISAEGRAGSPFAFPLRTTVYEKKGIQDGGDYLFSKLNLGFNIDLEQSVNADVNRYVTNLKWLFENQPKDALNRPRVRAFFETLLLMIRNKIILNEGDVAKTKVVWLAPSSMRRGTRNGLVEEWQKAFDRAFGGSGQFVYEPISESVAPYFYLMKKGVLPTSDAVNIDIGGGTSDIMLFVQGQRRYLNTSFRFAANDIWGGGLNEQGYPSYRKDNGFIQNYLLYKQRNPTPWRAEDGTLESFLQKDEMTAEDVVSLLFKQDTHFRFTQSMKDFRPALRMVLYLHYASIIYHLTQLVEANGLQLPRFLTFTGRGSQYLNLLGSVADLTEFTQLLFQAYSNQTAPGGFRIVFTDKPKETTANGAVLYQQQQDTNPAQTVRPEPVTYWGDVRRTDGGPQTDFIYNITSAEEARLKPDFHESVIENVRVFLEKTLKNRTIAAFLADFDIQRPEQYYDFLVGNDPTSRHNVLWDSYLLARLAIERDPDARLSETFFFLPLKHALYELSKHIQQ